MRGTAAEVLGAATLVLAGCGAAPAVAPVAVEQPARVKQAGPSGLEREQEVRAAQRTAFRALEIAQAERIRIEEERVAAEKAAAEAKAEQDRQVRAEVKRQLDLATPDSIRDCVKNFGRDESVCYIYQSKAEKAEEDKQAAAWNSLYEREMYCSGLANGYPNYNDCYPYSEIGAEPGPPMD